MKVCFAIYMLGMAVLAYFEPSLPVARDAQRTTASVREPAALRAMAPAHPLAARRVPEAALQR